MEKRILIPLKDVYDAPYISRNWNNVKQKCNCLQNYATPMPRRGKTGCPSQTGRVTLKPKEVAGWKYRGKDPVPLIFQQMTIVHREKRVSKSGEAVHRQACL